MKERNGQKAVQPLLTLAAFAGGVTIAFPGILPGIVNPGRGLAGEGFIARVHDFTWVVV